jgi:hypothetical protein
VRWCSAAAELNRLVESVYRRDADGIIRRLPGRHSYRSLRGEGAIAKSCTVPVKPIACGLSNPPSAMLTVPGRIPEAVGVNVTLIVQLDPDGKLPPTGQLLVWATLVLVVIPLSARPAPAVFDKVTVCGALVTPM